MLNRAPPTDQAKKGDEPLAYRLAYPFPDTHPWDVFPVGVGQHGVVSVDVSAYPHMLLFGHTGAGKSILQHALLLKAVGSPLWQVTILDPKRVEMSAYRTCRNVLAVATELDEMVAALEHALDDMQKRRDAMQTASLTHFTFLPDAPPAHLIVVDELYALLAPEGGTTDESKQRDEAHARCAEIIDTIARLGRPAGVHLVLTTQRPDAITLPGSLRANLDCRIALGRMNTAESLQVLDVDAATRTSPHPVGRGVIRRGNTVDRFQTYFVNPRILPSLVEATNHQANMER